MLLEISKCATKEKLKKCARNLVKTFFLNYILVLILQIYNYKLYRIVPLKL